MAVMGLLFPAVLQYTQTERHAGKSELALSRFSSCIMLLAYAAYLVFQLKSQKDLYVPIDEVGYHCYYYLLDIISICLVFSSPSILCRILSGVANGVISGRKSEW